MPAEPTSFYAGDTLVIDRVAPTLPDATGTLATSASYTLTYYVRPQTSSGTDVGSLTASANGQDFRLTVAASTTATWAVGDYYWSAVISSGSVRYTVASGTWEVLKNVATAGATDRRTHAEIALDAINAVMESRATVDQMGYSIAGRSLQKTPIEDLIKLKQFYEGQVSKEQAAAQLAAGLDSKNVIRVRF